MSAMNQADWDHLERIRTFESLISFAEMFEAQDEPPQKKKTPKPDYDWRVVVANSGGVS
jgi:hypothetical protein